PCFRSWTRRSSSPRSGSGTSSRVTAPSCWSSRPSASHCGERHKRGRPERDGAHRRNRGRVTIELSRVFLKEVLFDEQVAPLALDDVRRIAGLVERAQKRGEIRSDVVPMVAATNLFSAYYFTVLTWLGGFLTTRAPARSCAISSTSNSE